MIDRFGARAVALVGVPLSAMTFASLGLVGPSIWTWYLAWFFIALVADTTGAFIWITGVSTRFEKQRGLAFAVTMSGNGILTSFIPILALWLIATFGWRASYLVIASASVLILWPITWLLFHDLRSVRAEKGSPDVKSLPGVLFGVAVRDSRFWRLGFSFLVVAAAIGSMLVHLVPMLTDAGLSRTQAAAAMAAIGPCMVIGRLGSGFLLDRIHASIIGALASTFAAMACVLALQVGTMPWLAFPLAMVVGLGTGAESDIVAYTTARYFGMRSYGTIYGVLYGFFGVGVGSAPAVAGWVFDATGSYDTLLIALAIALAVATVLILSLGSYPVFATDEDD